MNRRDVINGATYTAIILLLLLIFGGMYYQVRQCERGGGRALRGWWGEVECVYQ